jgi:hypothetical protein
MECVQQVADIDGSKIESILWDLECSGMLIAATDENGLTTFSVAPMAQRLAGDIAREKGWEKDYIQRLRKYSSNRDTFAQESPLVRDLLAIRAQSIRSLGDEDREEILRRIGRALPTATNSEKIRLLCRKAECQRHLRQPVTADDTYSECAALLAANPTLLSSEERWHILLEAATVARARATNRSHIGKAIGHLEAAERIESDNSRATGMLAELYGLLGNLEKVQMYSTKAKSILEHEDEDSASAVNLSAALSRARENLAHPTFR